MKTCATCKADKAPADFGAHAGRPDGLREAAKIRATPAWANDFFISEAYRLAQLRTEVTGVEWQVDHMVPLRSPIVCGLHVHANLQVVTATYNRWKWNRLLPEFSS